MSLALLIQNYLMQPVFNLSLAVYIILFLLAIFSIIAGFLIVEDKPYALLTSALCQGLQIPLFYTSFASYIFSTGLLGALYFQKNPEDIKLGFEFRFGCFTELHLFKEMNFTIGINFIALLLFMYLIRKIKQKSNKNTHSITASGGSE